MGFEGSGASGSRVQGFVLLVSFLLRLVYVILLRECDDLVGLYSFLRLIRQP